MEIILREYQQKFLNSTARFPCLIGGVGTGKTFMLLLKVFKFCEDYPDSLALICRKEFTDLRDSTCKDFETYFQCKIDSNKEYHFPNGSKIMFRHASELAVLKNINLSIAAIEQAEEFENDDQFTFLRDRLRRANAPLQQLVVIANANGHNWIWRKWINNRQEGYDVVTATTWDNKENLPEAFLKDLEVMRIDAPRHYAQYVENSFEEMGNDDALFIASHVYESAKLAFPYFGDYGRILAVDVARFGEDETVFSCIEKVSDLNFHHIHQETWKNKSLMEVVGKTIDLKRQLKADIIVIDDTGMGGGVTDRLREMRYKVFPFNGGEAATNGMYFNKRSEAFFILKEMIDRKQLKIMNDLELQEQLMSVRYKFRSLNGKKALISKDEMRKEGLKSPDRADALAMACFYRDSAMKERQRPEAKPQLEFAQQGSYDPLKF